MHLFDFVVALLSNIIKRFNIVNILANKSFPASNVNIYMDTTSKKNETY